jgi:hypothetical protein
MAAVTVGIGALMIASSLTSAAFAQWWRPGTSQSIQQTNNCAFAKCSNSATNVAVGGVGSTSQTIQQTNNCAFAKCSNSATNVAARSWNWW